MANERKTRHGVGQDDLAWLQGVLWPGDSTGQEDPAEGGRDRYRLVPSAERPWLLLPEMTASASRRALSSGRRLQTRRQQAIRWAGVAAALGAPGRLGGGVVVVGHTSGVPARIIEEMGRRSLPLVLLGEPDPNRKPVLQLVEDSGRTIGYAKVGWNEATRVMVGREAATLERLDGAGCGQLRTPTVLSFGEHEDLGVTLLVTSPMPSTARRWSDRRPPPLPVLRELSEALSTEGEDVQHVSELAIWSDIETRLASIASAPKDCVSTLRGALASVRGSSSGSVRTGSWHGDLVPWNLARERDRVWVWDWEHSRDGVPVAWDRLHYRFGVLRHVRRRSTQAALTELRDEAPALLHECCDPAAATAVLLGYMAERWLRAWDLQRAGGGWDAAVHPAMVEVARAWTEA